MIFKMRGGIAKEHIIISPSENLEELIWNIRKNKVQFIDKTPIEIEVSDEGGIEYPDCLTRPLPLFSDKFKNFLEINNVDNIFYKPVYLVDTLLEEKHLYWIAVIPKIECFIDKQDYIEEKIGNFKIFRDEKKSSLAIYVTEELRESIEKENLEGIYFYNID